MKRGLTSSWVDLMALKRYEEESIEMQDKIFQLETYIEELEQSIHEIREQRNMAIEEARLASEHGLKLMRKTLMYRVCKRGKKIHFAEACPHFSSAESLEMCVKCLGEEAVTDSRSEPVTQT